MKDEQIKHLIQQTKLETSEDFTDSFMERLEASKQVSQESFEYRFKLDMALIVLSIIIVSLLIRLLLPGQTIVLILGIICMLFALNFMLFMKQTFQAQLKNL